MKPIVFYDIPSSSTDLSKRCWSPNTWKARFVLNYKNLPYTTVWVHYPDIVALSKRIGAPPTAPGAPYGEYTLPAIHDPNTGRAVSDSLAIARYLDAAYPDSPPVLPHRLDALSEAFNWTFNTAVMGAHLKYMLLPLVPRALGARDAAYFRPTREGMFGCKLEEVTPAGSAGREEHWRGTREAFGLIAGWLKADGKERRWVAGEEMSYADFVLAGFLRWMRDSLGPESAEWKEVESWDGGRWAWWIAAFEQYSAVDEGTFEDAAV